MTVCFTKARVAVVLAAALAALGLVGCGQQPSGGDMDRYQKCHDMGGAYKVENGTWSCKGRMQ